MKYIIILAFLLTACEKIVDLKIKDNQSTIIIEGNITNEAGPYIVKITRSVNLKETGEYPTVDDALVIISDNNGNTDTLETMGAGIYQTHDISGVEGNTYTLTVQADEKIYTAQSTMPSRVPFDSIKVETVKFAGDTEYNLIPVYYDPIITGNNYRFVLSVNDKIINQHFVFNDDVKNGAVNTSRLEVNTDDVEITAGDHISIEMQCVDANVALYYTTLALIGDSGPGGGTTPNNPVNNISNGALGLFSAHTTEHREVTIVF